MVHLATTVPKPAHLQMVFVTHKTDPIHALLVTMVACVGEHVLKGGMALDVATGVIVQTVLYVIMLLVSVLVLVDGWGTDVTLYVALVIMASTA